jgi:hypothetical protein
LATNQGFLLFASVGLFEICSGAMRVPLFSFFLNKYPQNDPPPRQKEGFLKKGTKKGRVFKPKRKVS